MPRKVTLPKLSFGKRRSVRQMTAAPKLNTPQDRAGRQVRYDVLDAPEKAPDRTSIIRIQIRTPITPRAIREQYLAALADYPEDQRADLAKQRLTALDVYLGDDIAAALEFYAVAEEACERVRIGSWDGERVQCSAGNKEHVNSVAMSIQAKHAFARLRLSNLQRDGLQLFCQQMTAMRQAPKPAEAAWALRLIDRGQGDRRAVRDAEKLWFAFLKRTGEDLRGLYVVYDRKTAGPV